MILCKGKKRSELPQFECHIRWIGRPGPDSLEERILLSIDAKKDVILTETTTKTLKKT